MLSHLMVFTSAAPLTEQMYSQIASAVTIVTTCHQSNKDGYLKHYKRKGH